MIEFDATCDPRAGKKIGRCKLCGGTCVIESQAVWNAPGDCAPLIDSYEYRAECGSCAVTMRHGSKTVEAAIQSATFVTRV